MTLKQLKQYTQQIELKLSLPLVMLGTIFLLACTQQPADDRPVILEIKGEPVYMDELEQLARVSLAQSNLALNSTEGQERFKEIAPNLYNTLIDIYVLKYAAEDMEVEPDPAEVDKRFGQIKKKLQDQGVYQQYLAGLGVDEARFKEAMKEKIASEMLSKKIFDESTVQVSEQDIGDYYYQNRENYRHPNRVRASHIFISKPDDETAQERSRKTAEQLRTMIGDSPQSTLPGLAQRYSEDPNTANRGGDLGFIKRNDTQRFDQDFLDKVFSMKEGEVSDVYESRVGYHIIWVTDHELSLDEATEEIRKHLINKKKTEAYAQWMDEQRRNMNINRLFDPETFEVFEPEST